MEMEVLAEGLEFPEGPIIMGDGSVVLVEIRRGTLTRAWQGKTEVIAQLGGGPNGAALGPDGAIYVCNNGGFSWQADGPSFRPVAASADYTTGRIERVDLATGKFERVYDSCDGNRLTGPNDIVFDRQGGFYFTDLGKTFARTRDRSGVYYATPDGGRITEMSYGGLAYNGVGLSPDEKTVYAAETPTGRLYAWDLAAPGVAAGGPRMVHASADRYDSLAMLADGSVAVATLGRGGVTTISPAGGATFQDFPDPWVTNICFGGPDMRDAYITLSGSGRLIRVRWPTPGLRLNHQQ
ncbi:MAG: gluconolaconase [Caulobacteraceae bacterium]|nr:gluconolaconase [Caulobacteraceae bacterium]